MVVAIVVAVAVVMTIVLICIALALYKIRPQLLHRMHKGEHEDIHFLMQDASGLSSHTSPIHEPYAHQGTGFVLQ